MGRVNFIFETRQKQPAVARPIENMQVKCGAFAGGFLCASPPGQLPLEGTGAGAVDGLAVGLHPPAHFRQALQGGLGDQPFARRADVEQVIAALAVTVNKISNQRPGGFPVLVAFLVAPRVVHGHAGLPIHPLPQAVGRDGLLRRPVVAVAALVGLQGQAACRRDR